MMQETISHYRIISQLGAGGMGEVYLAEDTQLRRKVALKLLPEQFIKDAERLSRFAREARAASALNHPNILTIHEVGQTDATHFIATEFVEGETLRALMQRGRMSVDEASDLAAQIASALAAAHEAGIVHRDIKPENVMLRRDRIVKVLDFGLVKLAEKIDHAGADSQAPTQPLVRTAAFAVMGTVPYMSPEQARGLDVDARTDIWSLGCVLYEMVAGRLPFRGETTSDCLAAILNSEPPPLSHHAPDVPPELERIVGKALRKDREERYQHVKDLLIDVRDLKRELEFAAKLERSGQPDALRRDVEAGRTVAIAPERTGDASDAVHVTSSAEYVFGGIKKHKLAALTALAAFVAALAVGGYFAFLAPRADAIKSIAVLPFQNASGNADVEYLSDGMTETLISSLSQIPNLNVKARSSVFRYKGREDETPRIGRELNVKAVLNGRVVQRGDDLTLYLSLVDAASENNIWSKQYNRKLSNLVALQSEITRDVSNNLKTKLTGADEQKLTKNYSDNAEAYQLYLKGRFQTLKLSPQEILKGVSYLQEAIQLDPNYALAHVGLADAYRSLALGGEQPPNEYFPKAKAAANRAIEIDDALGEAHAVLGFIVFWYDWDWTATEKHLKRALELNPNNSDAHFAYGQFLSTLGRFNEGLDKLKRAKELEPLNARTASLEARFLLNAGRREESFAAFRKIFEVHPNYWFAYTQAASAYNNEKMYTEAAMAARKARELNDFSSQAIALEGYALAKSGRQAEARAALQELLRLSKQRNVPPTNIAMIYCGLDEKDEAVAWLERAFRDKDPRITFLKIDRLWDDLRGDPRFQDLLRRVGLPPQTHAERMKDGG